MKNNVNLGKYDLNKLLRNPMTIHKIQDALLALKDESLFAQSLRDNAKDKPQGCIQMICDQYKDNPVMIKRIIGKEVLEMIEEFTGQTLANDIENLFN